MFLTSLKQFCIRDFFFCSFVRPFFIVLVILFSSVFLSSSLKKSKSVVGMLCVFFSYVTACLSAPRYTRHAHECTQSNPQNATSIPIQLSFLFNLTHVQDVSTTQWSILYTMQRRKRRIYIEEEENTNCYFTYYKKLLLFCLSNKNVNRRSSEPAETRASL